MLLNHLHLSRLSDGFGGYRGACPPDQGHKGNFEESTHCVSLLKLQ